ncbi:MAG: autotransporter-associated beta strand repeat-containing protein [Prevotella sp.]|nr:autotransporter-associated beta strand repeat-containing protein [Prevotella sp.]
MKTTQKLLLGMLLLLVCGTAANAQQLAFPEAQGWGRFATGGRTGTVYHVTNLNDSGTGSLRDAVSQPNRIVVFDVSGVIRINSRMTFAKNLYVAGQTAPGEGVTVYGDGVSFSGADNIILRYMRFRMGAVGTKDKDCAGIANGQNMIFDHCSFAWGQDENFSINWDNKGTAPQNITLQNCIVGQGLMTHSAGGLMQADNITLYRLLLVDNSTRNFKVKGISQYANCLVYNWKNAAYNMGGDSEGTSYVNIESNMFINGPAVGGDALTGGNEKFHFYGVDNWQDKNRDGKYNPTEFTGNGGGDRQSQPYDYPALEKWSARDLVTKLLPDVGASLPYRDLADCYMVDEVLSFGTKGKLITNENELPIGVPTTWSWFKGQKDQDTDGDGMPDWWEEAYGTDINKDDAMTIDASGYANIENYINGLSKADRQFFLRAPQLLALASSTTSSLALQWADYSDNEDGFIVEMKQGTTFVEVGRTSDSQFTIDNSQLTNSQSSLEPGKAYVVRVCAYKGNQKSEYTPELTVKTRPEQVDIIDCETFTGMGDGEWLINPLDDEVITLSEPTPKTAVVVYSDAHVTIGGTGYVSGSASMNKTGLGTLTIQSDQRYEGATVLHQGTYEFSSLKNGGVASGLGMSQEFAQNWVMDGGTYRYTGATTATNRSAQLYGDTGFDIVNSSAVVTMNGSFEGQGNLTIGGEGTMAVNTASFFNYDGDLRLEGGTVKLNSKEISDAGIGSVSRLVMAGGTFTTVGKNESSVTYNFPIVAEAGTTSTFDFDRWNVNKCSVSGTGTLQWGVNYLREYIEGNWDNFTGQLIITSTRNYGNNRQFAIRNGVGIRNATIYMKSGTAINGAKNESTYYLGGLSGEAGAKLSGFNVKAKGSGTWVVGGANTNETFRGVIDNNDQAGSHPGTTNIEKQGSGDWRLTGSNVYSGTTIVTKGRLIVNGNHTGTGAVTVRTGATLAGTGTLAANTTVNTGATLQAGDTLVNSRGLTFKGTLKLNGTATLIVPANRTQSNTLTLNGTTTLSGQNVLKIEFDEAPYDKTQYQVFKLQGGTISGTFASIEPATPGEGQTWDTSKLYSEGILTVVGGEQNPDQGTVDPQPTYETKTALLAWGNMINQSYDNSSYKNMMVGAENDEAYGFSLVVTGNLQKNYASAGTPKLKVEYKGEILERTAIKMSNGAQNTIFMPEGAKATKLRIYSVTGSNASSRTSYWKEVAGVSYTPETTTVLDLDAPRDNPNCVDFTLDNVPDRVTFTNTGEQQCVILYLEYHFGDDPAPLVGDVNNDGQVGIGDIVAITNIMAGLTTDEETIQRADVNGDDDIGIGDIVTITNIMAGLTE